MDRREALEAVSATIREDVKPAFKRLSVALTTGEVMLSTMNDSLGDNAQNQRRDRLEGMRGRLVKLQQNVTSLESNMKQRDDALTALEDRVAPLVTYRARGVLRSAAARIEQLIIEDTFDISRDALTKHNLHSVEAVEMSLSLHDASEVCLPSDVVEVIRAKMHILKERVTSLSSDAIAGIELALNGFSVSYPYDAAEVEDPADSIRDWRKLREYCDTVFPDADESRKVTAMLNVYVSLRKCAKSALETPAPIVLPNLN